MEAEGGRRGRRGTRYQRRPRIPPRTRRRRFPGFVARTIGCGRSATFLSCGHLLGTAEMRFRLIDDHREIWPARVMCEALSVSPSGYYAWRSRPDSPRKIANRALLVDIRRVHAQHRERYGAPRIHAARQRLV